MIYIGKLNKTYKVILPHYDCASDELIGSSSIIYSVAADSESKRI